MSYETVQGLYDRLKKEDPERLIGVSSDPSWTRYVFANGRQVSHMHTKSNENWNILQLVGGTSLIKDLLKVIEPFLKEHGGDVVAFSNCLVDPTRMDLKLSLVTRVTEQLSGTHLNSDRAFEMQFRKIAEVIEDRELRLTWLKKNLPDSQTIYCVENKFYFMLSDLFRDYSEFGSDWVGEVFEADPECSRVLICKLRAHEMKSMFHKLTPDEMRAQIKALTAAKAPAKDVAVKAAPPAVAAESVAPAKAVAAESVAPAKAVAAESVAPAKA